MKKRMKFSIRKALLSIILFLSFQYSKAQFSCTGFNTTNISYTGGVQTFTVPPGTSQVRISLTGASGGLASATANNAGGGAIVYAYVNVVAGDNFRVIIGQKGVNGAFEAGGGGSSAVYKNGTLIMVAGGGGGEDNTGDGGNGIASVNGGDGGDDAGTSGSGGCGTSVNNGRGGTAGNGGNHGEFSANCVNGGGGGGGLNSAGQGNGNTNAGQPGGRGNINGASGGVGALDDAAGTNGGWGWSGGGGADDRESGGGGGYSGGGGGPESRNPGGGGSFVAAIGTNGITASGKTDGTGTTTGYNGSGIICSPVLIILPVSFESFTVQATPGAALLQWTVSQEINTAYYQVEKSIDGITFNSIGIVHANGTSGGAREYSFTDNTISGQKTFYRIKVADADSRFSYSVIRYINGGRQDLTLTAYPNPVKEKISIVLPQNWNNGKNKIMFINATGQIVLDKQVAQLQNDFDVSGLPAGVYLVKAVNTRFNQQLSATFVK